MSHGIQLLHGLASAHTSARTLGLRFDPVTLAPMRLSNDRRLPLDVAVAPAAVGPYERSWAVTRSAEDVLWQKESDRCRSRAEV
jgi:hypothetical protein